MHKLFGEQKLAKLKEDFSKKVGVFEKEISGLNQLPKLILKYLLELRESRDPFGRALVKHFFGKIALEQIKTLGINEILSTEKLRILKLFEKSFKEKKLKVVLNNQFNRNLNGKGILNIDLLEIPGKSVKNNSMLPILNFSQKFIFQNKIEQNICDLFMKLGVPFRYIEHWLWLKKYARWSLKLFEDFHFLIVDVYCENLEQANWINGLLFRRKFNGGKKKEYRSKNQILSKIQNFKIDNNDQWNFCGKYNFSKNE